MDVLVPRELGGSLADRGKWSPGREVASRWQHRLNPSCLCGAPRAGGVPELAAGLPLAGSGGTEHFIQTEHSPLKRNANKIIKDEYSTSFQTLILREDINTNVCIAQIT